MSGLEMSSDVHGATEHDYYDRAPIVGRARLAWPEGKRLALAVVVSLEYYEMQPPPDAFIPPNVPGMFGRAPYPDFGSWSRREYGNRVGVFRIMEALDREGIRATAAMDSTVASNYPVIVGQCRHRGWEIAGHGQAVTRVISSDMSEDEERRHLKAALDGVESACGTRPLGWHGAEYGESQRTPALLAELGVRYVLDWPNDEQPYLMRTPSGPLVSMPMAIDFDDVYAIWQRKLPPGRWRQSVEDAVDRLLADGAQNGRLLVLNLHPWLTGHPFRVTYLAEMLASLRRRGGIWFATAGEIAEWYRAQRAG